MTEEIYTIPEHPVYSETIRKLQDDDPVSASRVVNPLVQRLVENIAALKRLLNAGADDVEDRLNELNAELDRQLQQILEEQRTAAAEAAVRVESLEKTIHGAGKLTGTGDPTAGVAAQVGQIYIDLTTGTEWKCVAVGASGTVWEKQTGSTVGLTATDVGARPDTWTPTAAEVGARPDTWTPTASDVGAVPNTVTVNGKKLSGAVVLPHFYAGTAAPSDTGLLWIDTTANTGGLKYWNGSAWVYVPVAYT